MLEAMAAFLLAPAFEGEPFPTPFFLFLKLHLPPSLRLKDSSDGVRFGEPLIVDEPTVEVTTFSLICNEFVCLKAKARLVRACIVG